MPKGARIKIMKRIIEYITEEKYENRPIKDVLKNRYKMSSALISKLKKSDDGIMVNGRREFVNYTLKLHDILRVVIEEGASKNIVPIFSKLDILYEDEDILAVNKPFGMPTHTSIGHHTDTLANAVLFYLNKNGEEHTFHAVTRLDKDTTGVVLIAKNRYAHDLFSELLREKRLEKSYLAIVSGKLFGEGIIDKRIKRENESIIKRTVAEDGQEATTHFEVIDSNDMYSYVRLYPKTGRTHQIRVHMSSIGHPLVGDVLYGGESIVKRHLLHCESISFFHPVLKKQMSISSNPASDFTEFFKAINIK